MQLDRADARKESLNGLINQGDDGCSLFDAPAPAVCSNASRLFADLDGDEDFVPREGGARPSSKASCASRESGGSVAGHRDGPIALEGGLGYPAAPKKGAVRHINLPVREAIECQELDSNEDAVDDITAQWNEMQHEGWRPVMPAWHRDPSEMHAQDDLSATALCQEPAVSKQYSDSEDDDEDIDWAATQLPEHERICIGFKDIDQWSDHDGEASTCSMSDPVADDEGSELDDAMLESELVIGYRADVGCGDGFPEEDTEEEAADEPASEVCDEEIFESTEEKEELGRKKRRKREKEKEEAKEEEEFNEALLPQPPTPLPPPPPPKVDHVLLVVHGIGATDEGNIENIQLVRETLETVRKHWFWHMDVNIHVEMMDWKCSVVEQQTSIFEKITPSDARGTLGGTRMTLNATLSDVIFYKTAHHRQLILDTVISKMNVYVQSLRMDPSGCFSDSKISVIGHSLGSVILYDVLTGWQMSGKASTPLLDFQVENFFLWGSPVAAMVSIANFDATQGEFALPENTAVYNIFHPHDPVAFRLEPLCYHDQDVVQPEMLPHWENNGTRPDKEWVRSYEYAKGVTIEKWAEVTKRFWKALGSGTESANYWVRRVQADQMFRFTLSSSRNSGPGVQRITEDVGAVEEDGSEEKEQMMPDVRLDFALQEHAAEAIVEQYGLLQSHGCYWTSKDVALFMLKKLTQNELSPYPASHDNDIPENGQAAMPPGEGKNRPLASLLGLQCLGRDDK
eukprot:gnl/MRDRNA2_/MRDRNA2_92221_c0_seq1.p1 gnl/MRDRNA2_/MRDRNA2_92221_c0~~gnl/MRDRNA2_/MRDRNA2_92221_c0_seq1.p1  ORF type:complete len:741 (+),score=150.31 gnl/MRDRNA2_/MRDRNA2_92221_c0_seq1:85-2307(+)